MVMNPNDFDVNFPRGSNSPRITDDELRKIKAYTRNGYNDHESRISANTTQLASLTGQNNQRTIFETAGTDISAGTFVGLSSDNRLFPWGTFPVTSTGLVSEEVGAADATVNVNSIGLAQGVLNSYRVGQTNVINFYNVANNTLASRAVPSTGVTLSGTNLSFVGIDGRSAVALYEEDGNIIGELLTVDATAVGATTYNLVEHSTDNLGDDGDRPFGRRLTATTFQLYFRDTTINRLVSRTVTVGTDNVLSEGVRLTGTVDFSSRTILGVSDAGNVISTDGTNLSITSATDINAEMNITGATFGAVHGNYLYYQTGNDIRIARLAADGSLAYEVTAHSVASSVIGDVYHDTSTTGVDLIRATYFSANNPQVLTEARYIDSGTALTADTNASVTIRDFTGDVGVEAPNIHTIARDPSSGFMIVNGRFDSDAYTLGYNITTTLQFLGYSEDGGMNGQGTGYFPRGSLLTLENLVPGTTYYLSPQGMLQDNNMGSGTFERLGDAISNTRLLLSTEGSSTSVGIVGSIAEDTTSILANTLTYSFGIGNVATDHDLFLGGMKLLEGTDYTVNADRSDLTLTSQPSVGLVLELINYNNFSVTDALSRVEGGTISGRINTPGGVGTNFTVSDDARVSLTDAVLYVHHTGSGTVTIPAHTVNGAIINITTQGTMTLAWSPNSQGVSLGNSAKIASGIWNSAQARWYFSETVY